MNVLIVDDEVEIREGLLSFQWDELGMTVAGVCEHGLQAYMRMQEQPADIVLTDIRMPHMDELELAS